MKDAVALRKAVLKVLADNVTAGYVDSETLLGKVEVDRDTLDKQMLYLEGKGYVRLLRELGSTFIAAEITADGIEIIWSRMLASKGHSSASRLTSTVKSKALFTLAPATFTLIS